MIQDYNTQRKVWVIRKHSINSNDISKPEIATIVGVPTGYYYPHVKVEYPNGNKQVLPVERCFDTLREAVDYVDKVYEKQLCSYYNVLKMYEASKKKTDDMKIMINDLMANPEYR